MAYRRPDSIYFRLGLLAALVSFDPSSVAADLGVEATDAQKEMFEGQAELSGRLTWATGEPAADETFDLIGYIGSLQHLVLKQVKTDSDGRYRVTGLHGKGARYRLWLATDHDQRTMYIPMPADDARVEYDYQYQPRVGEKAPPHVMPDLDGNPVDLADLRGKVVVLKFWAVWCGPCHPEMIAMGEAMRRNPQWGDDVVVVAVNADTSLGKVKKFIKDRRLEGMVHLFEEGTGWPPGRNWAAVRDRNFHVNSIPFTFVIDREGIVRYRSDKSPEIEKVVNRLLGG